jgi:hypothetical protein
MARHRPVTWTTVAAPAAVPAATGVDREWGDSDELIIALAALLEKVGGLDSLLRTSTRGTP